MYNQGLCRIEKLFDVPSIIKEHPSFSTYARKIEFGIANHNKNSDFKLFAISVPNNGGISQAICGVVILKESTNFAQYFTMESSFGGEYAVVSPSESSRANFGFVKTPQEFTERVLQIALEKGKQGDQLFVSASKPKQQNKVDRIDSIEILLESGVEWFQNDFFPLTEKAKLECALLVGSTLIRCISESDIIAAIHSNRLIACD